METRADLATVRLRWMSGAMNQRCFGGLRRLAIAALVLVVLPGLLSAQVADTRPPNRRTLAFHGVEREHFVHLPPGFDRNKSYWLLVAVGTANGRTFFLP